MFENLVSQNISKSIISDIKNNSFPRSVLYSGPVGSGKLTAALETARIFGCRAEKKGQWQCECSACLQSKALTFNNIMLLGPRDCSLEISAAKKTFLEALSANASYLNATRYLFLRSIRKLTLRFNPILWEGENNLSKIGNIIQGINENLELLDFPRELPEYEKVSELCDSLEKDALKLEEDFLYDSIPVNQIRNLEDWARIKSDEGKKTVIIENADRMQNSVRNALLKILEEPPQDCVFILLTSKRNSIMQTILSRVRTYTFSERTAEQQKSVISRVYHNESFTGNINEYLLTFLPVSPEVIKKSAAEFCKKIALRQIPDCAEVIKECGNFSPRIELDIFLKEVLIYLRKIFTAAGENNEQFNKNAQAFEFLHNLSVILHSCRDNIMLYNQTPLSAFEILLRDISALNIKYEGIMKICVNM